MNKLIKILAFLCTLTTLVVALESDTSLCKKDSLFYETEGMAESTKEKMFSSIIRTCFDYFHSQVQDISESLGTAEVIFLSLQ